MNLRKKSHGDLPATVRLVKEVRSELRAEIRALDAKMDSRFTGMKSDFQSLRSDFEILRSDFESLRADVHRSLVLTEEQRAENRIVLDGLKVVLDRQDRLEQEHAQTRRTVDSLAELKQ